MARYNYGAPVYSDLVQQDQLKKKYGKGVMAVIVEQVSKSAFKIPDATVDRSDVTQTS